MNGSNLSQERFYQRNNDQLDAISNGIRNHVIDSSDYLKQLYQKEYNLIKNLYLKVENDLKQIKT